MSKEIKMREKSQKMFALVLGIVFAGCGPAAPGTMATGLGGSGGEPAEGGVTVAEGNAYLPLAIGAAWTYRVSNPAGTTADKMTVVEAMEPAGGTAGPVAFRIRNEALDGTTINWEQLSGMVMVRYRQHTLDTAANLLLDKTYAPSSVVFDESGNRLVAGATWNETYAQTQTPTAGQPKTSQELVKWTVEAIDDVVSVPAGVFTCIRVRRHHSSSMNPADEVTWYAQGTGRVKETGAGSLSDETRELVSVTLP
jgi:hypothetical protein